MTFYAYVVRLLVLALVAALGVYYGHGAAPAAAFVVAQAAREALMGFIGELDESHAVLAAALLAGEALLCAALLAWACS